MLENGITILRKTSSPPEIQVSDPGHMGPLACGTCANGADQNQTPHNAASDQSLHCLL